MSRRTAITVHRSREELERLWQEHQPSYVAGADAAVTFKDAPGDRGTEIHVDLEGGSAGGRIGDLVAKISGGQPALAKVTDDLRRFKQLVETGEIPRSEGSPGGESLERKLKQRPAQPLSDDERQKAGV